jgi:predicted amidophosphoribosyltransferase
MLHSVLRILRTFFRLTSITCHHLRLRLSVPKIPICCLSTAALRSCGGGICWHCKAGLEENACCTREGTRAFLWYVKYFERPHYS